MDRCRIRNPKEADSQSENWKSDTPVPKLWSIGEAVRMQKVNITMDDYGSFVSFLAFFGISVEIWGFIFCIFDIYILYI